MNRVNPLALASVGVFAVFGSLAIDRLDIALFVMGTYLLFAVLFVRRWKYLLITLGFAGLAALAVAYSTWRLAEKDLEIAATAGLRIMILAWPGAVVAGLIDPMRLGDYLAQNLSLPPKFVVATSSAGMQLGSLTKNWEQLGQTRRARGVDQTGFRKITAASNLAFSLFVSALRQATEQAILFDSRGFADSKDRTWAEPASWTRLDALTVVVGFLLASMAPVLRVFID